VKRFVFLTFLFIFFSVVYACPNLQPSLFLNNTNISVTSCYYQSPSYICTINDNSTGSVISYNVNLTLNCSDYVFENKTIMNTYFTLSNVSWEVQDKMGFVYYNISMKILQPQKIEIIGDSVLKNNEVYASTDISLPIKYDFGDTYANYTNNTFTVRFNSTNYTVYYSLIPKDINLPRITNLIYPTKVTAGKPYSLFVDCWDNWKIVNVTLVINASVNDSRILLNKVGDTRFSLDRVEISWGEKSYKVQVVDSAENTVVQDFIMTVLPKDFLYVTSIDIPALAIKKPYEETIFKYDEDVTFKIKLSNMTWVPKIVYTPPVNTTNTTNVTTTTIPPQQVNQPSIMFKVGSELINVKEDEWHDINKNEVKIYFFGMGEGDLSGSVEFNFTEEYKVLSNVSSFKVKFSTYTMLPNQTLDVGGRIAQCSLYGTNNEMYRCYTEFSSNIDLQNTAWMITKFDLDILRASEQLQVNTLSDKLKDLENIKYILIIIIIILIVVLVLVWFRWFSSIRWKW